MPTHVTQLAKRSVFPVAALSVPLVIDCPRNQSSQPFTVGLPFPRGKVDDAENWMLMDAAGDAVPLQTEATAHWSDGSVRWLLLDFVTGPLRMGQHHWQIRQTDTSAETPEKKCRSHRDEHGFSVDTELCVFRVNRSSGQPLLQVRFGGQDPLTLGETQLTLTDAKGHLRKPVFEKVELENAGDVRTTIRLEGTFTGHAPCRFLVRICFFADTGLVRLRVTVLNPRAAKHRGNLWDLGDPGSTFLRDLSIHLGLPGLADGRIRWSEEPDRPFREARSDEQFEIYQESSGGENWQSRNHVNRHDRVPLTFRGYRIRAGRAEQTGFRASPIVRYLGKAAAVTVGVSEFWQQFPKAIECDRDALRVRLFPGQFPDLFELQGGEQKTHTVWLHFGARDVPDDVLDWVRQPADAHSTPEWYCASGAFPEMTASGPGPADRLDDYLRLVLEGPHSLFARREVIDEYGWRNFGDLYADHEAAYYPGPIPVISHLNNQFDSVYGSILQYARTGDRRWRDLFSPLARHVIDIDIYHAERDRAAYAGGLFWMTDHYRDAATCTHRTYSRANCRSGQPNGGGPANEHNFTTGLLCYYHLTGDPLAREAVIGLADWTLRMDDGRLTVLGWFDTGRTGLASFTRDPGYHGPGRGAGFSINALLDGWLLAGLPTYLTRAEELIRRCIHPTDDIAARDLLNAELRWSYTIFLVTLARYLRLKAEANDLDAMYAFAQTALLNYAAWMVENERPYFDQRERLEYPTETWAAQEFRKANVLRLAAAHADEPLHTRLLQRGLELADRAWEDLLSFDSRLVARAVAIMMTEGTRDQFYRQNADAPAPRPQESFDFGKPTLFVSQRQRVKALFRYPSVFVQAATRLFWPSD